MKGIANGDNCISGVNCRGSDSRRIIETFCRLQQRKVVQLVRGNDSQDDLIFASEAPMDVHATVNDVIVGDDVAV